MKCIYCQSDMRPYNYAKPNKIWMCDSHRPSLRVDFWCVNDVLQQIQFVIWKSSAQFPYIIATNIINKTTQLFHLPDRPKVIDYNNEYEWAKCLERINQEDVPIFTLNEIPNDLNPDTANQFLDRYLKLLSFY